MAAVSGSGNIVNRLIDKLPVELHLPGYNYCGPGTRLERRLARNDQGINPLDSACKQHDIAYATHKGLEERQRADKVFCSFYKGKNLFCILKKMRTNFKVNEN